MATKSLLSLVFTLSIVMIVSPARADETAERAARAERFLAKAQRICPVTGNDLTSMGGPFKAEVEGQTVFLCCKGCVGRPLNPQHWATVRKNLRMAHLALAQEICPVMGKDLLSMGGPVKAEVDGQITFLCCKGCLKKQVQPKYWGQIQDNLKAAQKLCPVREVELGDEAVPVIVEKRVVYVCCKTGNCIKKVKAKPDKYLAVVDGLLAKSFQRVEQAPTANAKPSNPERPIFTCPMHPDVQRTRPDKCPICGMKLVAEDPVAPQPRNPNHTKMPMNHEKMQHDAPQPGVEPMGCGCSTGTEMMKMGTTKAGGTKTPVTRSVLPIYRSHVPPVYARRCGC